MSAITVVPTLPDQVRQALRQRGEPVRLFGENLANVRERLRSCLVLEQEQQQQQVDGQQLQQKQQSDLQEQQQEQQTQTQYTRASVALVEARQYFCATSLQRARERLQRERTWKKVCQQQRNKRRLLLEQTNINTEEDTKPQANESSASDFLHQLDALDSACRASYSKLRHNLALEASQYGDRRVLSSMACGTITWNNESGDYGSNSNNGLGICVTGSWTGRLHAWNVTTTTTTTERELALLTCLGQMQGHDDRIMGIALQPLAPSISTSSSSLALIATTSLDGTAKLWSLEHNNTTTNNNNNKNATNSDAITEEVEPSKNNNNDNDDTNSLFTMKQLHVLSGHKARTCRAAFYPTTTSTSSSAKTDTTPSSTTTAPPRYVATTSFDHSWRLWCVATGNCLLLQDGHAAPVYGIHFHPDGGIVATSDLLGVVHLWDLRTGKTIQHYTDQHAGRVLNVAFHPGNGVELATAGDDGTIQIFDLRRKAAVSGVRRANNTNKYSNAAVVSIPAHSHLISSLQFDATGDTLASSSFDGTVKLWSSRGRKYNMLNQLLGHQGKVTSVGIINSNLNNNNDGSTSASSSCSPTIITCGFDKTLKLWK